jgi:hypothetical protein
MDKEKVECLKDLKDYCKKEGGNNSCHCHHRGGGSSGGAVYGMGLIGVLFYYLPHCVTFSDYAMSIFKALVWPAFLVFKAYTMLQM